VKLNVSETTYWRSVVKYFHGTGQSRSTLKLIRVLVISIAVMALTIQPMATSYAIAPGYDPGPNP